MNQFWIELAVSAGIALENFVRYVLPAWALFEILHGRGIL